ncbi:MAG: MFS transporter [Candidatus Obscuribacterales bacterium]|nr:MFS transporter [Candidatus Obscuribacterales bacterium]
MTQNQQPTGNGKGAVSGLIAFFSIAYFCQHFAQSGLLFQPMQYYFKEVFGYTETMNAAFIASLVMPWTIKPLYGLISDYLPLFGYRRKSYLLILNLLAMGCFFYLTGVSDPATIRIALITVGFCTAFSDVAVDGLMVELGNKTGQTASFQSMQWIWFNIAAIVSSLTGGYLIQYFGVHKAFNWACGLTVASPFVVVIATWFLVKEEKTKVNTTQLVQTTKSLRGALASKTLWVVTAFIVFWQFSPSFGMPFYYYQTDVLKFSQTFIAQLAALGSVASVIGAWVFKRYLGKYRTKTLLSWSAALGAIGTVSYMLLLHPAIFNAPITACVLGFVFGITAQVAMLATLNLAAEACPKHVEALTFSVLMSIFNLSMQGSSVFGAWLYESVFDRSMAPLIIVSAVFTLLCLPLVRFLPEPAKDE